MNWSLPSKRVCCSHDPEKLDHLGLPLQIQIHDPENLGRHS